MKLNDGIVSLATSLGNRAANRTFVAGKRLTDKQLADLYENNWIVQKYINVRTTDMTRLDREVLSADFDQDGYEKKARRLGFIKAREECLQWASLYGDALILAITDQEDLSLPLQDHERIQRFLCLDKTAYDVGEIEDDITSAAFGKPRLYTINGDIIVHNSRVARLEGGKRSFKDRTSKNNRYGTSDIQAIKEPLFNFLTVCANIFDIVEESKTDVVYVEGFDMGIAANREDDFQTLALAMNSIKSSTSTLFLDNTARWEQKELSFAGLTDIWNQARTDLAGSLRMPITKLFGQSASGFASGEEDNQNYYEDIASMQESRLRALDEFGDKFMLDESIDFKYPSIELSNEVEKSTILGTTVTALSSLYQDAIITEAQYAKELKSRDLIAFTDEDIEELKELNSAEEIESYATEQTGGGLLPQANAGFSGSNARYGRW